ncbi:MAG: hypothetical protein HFJ37_04885 [Clostridia bacterium]|nr:hypothetical protein [Clostridia bacterium]
MEAKDTLKMPWRAVSEEEWDEEMIYTSYWNHKKAKKEYFFSKRDLKIFVEKKIKDLARELGISYQDLERIFKQENTPFYEFTKDFKDSREFNIEGNFMANIKRLLIIPDVTHNNLVKITAIFHSLTEEEKILFLIDIGEISIKIEKKE